MSQQAHSRANRAAWSHRLQDATEQLGGSPQDEAAQLQADPRHTLRDYIEHLGDVRGQRVANLLGSSGKKAVALSLLGAQVTVVDFAEDNKTRALACARAAGVELDYILSDVLEWPTDPFEDHFDIVLMEYGILHYFVDLQPLVAIIAKILKPQGKLVLHEYHPLNRKCLPRKDGDNLVLDGDYFCAEIIEKPAPRQGMAFSQGELAAFPTCRIRYWQLGEVVTAVGSGGLMIESLTERPHAEFLRVPGMFTLVARKIALASGP